MAQTSVESFGSLLPGVTKGRHNVAHHGSGGEAFDDDQKTPSGATQGTQPGRNTPLYEKAGKRRNLIRSLPYAFNLGNSRSAFPRLMALQSLSENPGYTSRPGSVKS